MTHSRLLRAVTLATALCAATTLLTACGGEKSSGGTADTPSATVAAAPEAPADKGAATYGQICASCHQATGVGVDGTYPPLKASKWLLGDPNVPIAIVLAGLQGEITVERKTYSGAMQPWGMLSDDDVAAVLTYARSQWGNAAGPVTSDQVKEVREKMGSRSAWTVEELVKAYPTAGK